MSGAQIKHQTINRVLAICAAVAILIAALIAFISFNSQRIVEQNNEFLEASSSQTARRLNDVFDSCLNSLQGAATICEQALKNGDISIGDVINDYGISSQFDNAIYVSSDGTAYNGNGESTDVSDRLYYTAGMRGESGVCFIESAVFDGRNILAFYAPVYDGDAVAGVLVTIYREETLVDVMTTDFYGEPTPTYLCMPDGTVVAQSDPTRPNASNISEVFSEEIEGTSINELVENTASGNSEDFTYHTNEGIGNTCLTKLSSYDWVLVRSFPASVTNKMISEASLSGFIIVGGMVIAAVIVIVLLMLQARRRNEVLLLERRKATRIIDTSTNLFSGMLSINLTNGTYEFFKSTVAKGIIPAKGKFADLIAFFGDYFENATQDTESILLQGEGAIRKALPSATPFIQEEWKEKTKSGNVWYQASIMALERNAQGDPVSLLVAIQEISELKEQEAASRQALQEAFRAAEHASRAKSDFLNSMSHDIRTPMNSIMGLTAIASMHVDEPTRVRECLNNITSASRHLLGLINEVLDMAKIESGSINLSEEAFDLPESIENLIAIMNPQITAKGQKLKVNLANIKHEHVIGDPTRLQQVFVNIMGNSVKFTPEGGTIGLRIAEIPSRLPDCGCYEFTFSDTGCGMSEEFLKVIFDPFSRANDSRTTKVEGTGLGMAIVKSVVSLMNGSIDVASKEGEGTTFTVVVHLKLRDGGLEDLSDLKDMRVLVVDDEEFACEGACTMLDSIGMRSSFALSGRKGIEDVKTAEAEHDPFRAVILDWHMPEMSGIETARRIRQITTENVPIIILSAYDWSMIEQEAREVGVDAFISKPLFRSRLIQVMRELMSGDPIAVMDERTILESLAFSDKRVLLAEDNMMAAVIAEELIGMTGAVVEHAEHGKAALEMLLAHDPGYYDIVLMDIQMPVMNGYDATTAIRKEAENRPDLGEIPIVALSADAFAEDIRHAHLSGMNDHMSKPLEIQTLVRMLKKWMA